MSPTRDAFERNVLTAAALGAAAGLLQLVLAKLALLAGFDFRPFPALDFFQPVSIGALGLCAAALATAKGDRTDRWLLRGLALVLPGLSWLLGAEGIWKPLLGGAVVGLLMVRGQLCALGAAGTVGAPRPTARNYALAALLTAGLAAAGVATTRILADALVPAGAPGWLLCLFAGACIAFFTALGSLPAHRGLTGDPTLPRLNALVARARGELQPLLSKGAHAYAQATELISALPRDPAREALADLLGELAKDLAERTERWVELEPHLAAVDLAGLDSELDRLGERAAASKDRIARQQLELAREALRQERERIGELAQRRERLFARIEADVALLGSTRMALLQARSSQAQLGPDALNPITARLGTLLRLEREQDQLQDARVESALESPPVVRIAAGLGTVPVESRSP